MKHFAARPFLAAAFIALAAIVGLAVLAPAGIGGMAQAATTSIGCITVGAGLLPQGQQCANFRLRVKFLDPSPKNGNTANVARADHTHLGEAWSGAAAQGLQITNTQDGSAAFKAVASSFNGTTQGIWGITHASGNNTVGVFGQALGGTGSPVGAWGYTDAALGTGVRATGAGGNAIGSTALEIQGGGIRVTGAGNNTQTPVFVHTMVRTGGSANMGCNANTTVLDNIMVNEHPDYILIVTPNGGQDGGYVNAGGALGVAYDASGSYFTCNSNAKKRWVIYRLDGGDIPNGAKFNVMVFKP